jgi:hypothetical protein
MNSGLALLEDGVPSFVLEEERFNREKHTRGSSHFAPFRNIGTVFRCQLARWRAPVFQLDPWIRKPSLGLLNGFLDEGSPSTSEITSAKGGRA